MSGQTQPPETGSPGATEPYDITSLIDQAPWSRFQKWLLTCFALVFAVDGLANQSLGIVLPALIADWDVPRNYFAPVTAANLAGVALGSVLGGLLGDRIGRRWALIGAILLFGVMTFAGGFSQNVTQLMMIRFIDGIGIGAAIPNGAALIAEFTPARRRGRAIAIGMVFIPIGGIIAGALGASLLEMVGWRPLFFIAGVLPLSLAALFMFTLPESPAFLLREGKLAALVTLLGRCGITLEAGRELQAPPKQAAMTAPLSMLLSPALRTQTLLLWGGFFTCLMASYTLFSWVPTMLHTLGLDLTMTSLGITTFHLGGVVGALISGVLLDRYGFSSTHMGMAALAAIMAVVMAFLLGQSVLPIMLILSMMMLLGLCVAGLHNTLYTLATTVCPIEARATGVGIASATGRLGAVLSSFTGVLTMDMGGPLAFFGLVALLLALCGVSGWVARSFGRAA